MNIPAAVKYAEEAYADLNLAINDVLAADAELLDDPYVKDAVAKLRDGGREFHKAWSELRKALRALR